MFFNKKKINKIDGSKSLNSIFCKKESQILDFLKKNDSIQNASSGIFVVRENIANKIYPNLYKKNKNIDVVNFTNNQNFRAIEKHPFYSICNNFSSMISFYLQFKMHISYDNYLDFIVNNFILQYKKMIIKQYENKKIKKEDLCSQFYQLAKFSLSDFKQFIVKNNKTERDFFVVSDKINDTEDERICYCLEQIKGRKEVLEQYFFDHKKHDRCFNIEESLNNGHIIFIVVDNNELLSHVDSLVRGILSVIYDFLEKKSYGKVAPIFDVTKGKELIPVSEKPKIPFFIDFPEKYALISRNNHLINSSFLFTVCAFCNQNELFENEREYLMKRSLMNIKI